MRRSRNLALGGWVLALAMCVWVPLGLASQEAAPRYPTPSTHAEADFLEAHGANAGPAQCSTCHARRDCTSCHVGSVSTPVAEMPPSPLLPGPGVGLERRPPASHTSPFWGSGHGAFAGADASRCTTCHLEASCTGCHDAALRGGFHPPNFQALHSSDAYGRTMECVNCHSTEVFCRECHTESGVRASAGTGAGLHDAEPLWLLRHGQAARQQLEGCASCHEQRDCLRCHSERGAFRINPHADGFDAARAKGKNAAVCFACHLSDPIGGPG